MLMSRTGGIKGLKWGAGKRVFPALAMALFLYNAGSALADDILRDTWSDGTVAGWVSGASDVTLSNPDGYLQILLSAQSKPDFGSGLAKKAVTNSLIPARVSFKVRAFDKKPSAVRVCIHSSNGNMWFKNVDISNMSDWEVVDVPVDFSAGWVIGPLSLESQFLADMAAIDWVGVYIVRNASMTSQAYGLDDFVLTGRVPGGAETDTDNDGIPDSWEVLNGMDPLSAEDALLDSDGDGMSNLAEYIAGTDPLKASSLLAVDMSMTNVTEEVTGFVLSWSSAAGRTYGVQRAESLLEGFSLIAPNITATPPVNVYIDTTATNSASYFYRIDVK
jgi:hypothetical protein